MNAPSMTSMPRRFASSIAVWRVMPSRKQSAVGVMNLAILMKKMLPVHSATRPAVKHHGVGIAFALGLVLGDGAVM